MSRSLSAEGTVTTKQTTELAIGRRAPILGFDGDNELALFVPVGGRVDMFKVRQTNVSLNNLYHLFVNMQVYTERGFISLAERFLNDHEGIFWRRIESHDRAAASVLSIKTTNK
jgi:hypothetical protein